MSAQQNKRKRSLTDAGIGTVETLSCNKKRKLNDDETVKHTDDNHKVDKISCDLNLLNLCEQCMNLIMKCLSPKERIQCFIICKEIKKAIQDQESKTIWNDVRLSLKHSSNITNINGVSLPNLNEQTQHDLFTLRLIHSECSYPKSYRNCIQVSIDKHYKDIQNTVAHHWIFKCIPNVEIYNTNITIYHKLQHISLVNTKYLEFDSLNKNALKTLPQLTKIFPNVCYLSIINLGHDRMRFDAFNDLFAPFGALSCLKHIQFWDCTAICFRDVVTALSMTRIVSLDMSFCSFHSIVDIENIMDQLQELKYLSFVSNGVVCTSKSKSKDNILNIPETLVFLKYCGEVLIDGRHSIHLDLSKCNKSGSLMFVDCCIDDRLLLEQIARYCSDSIQYISLNYAKENEMFLHRHWDKYKALSGCVVDLHIGIHYLEDIQFSDAQKQTLQQFLNRTFAYDFESVVSRQKLYQTYFRCVVSHINDMAKLYEATDFFEW